MYSTIKIMNICCLMQQELSSNNLHLQVLWLGSNIDFKNVSIKSALPVYVSDNIIVNNIAIYVIFFART